MGIIFTHKFIFCKGFLTSVYWMTKNARDRTLTSWGGNAGDMSLRYAP